MKKAEIEALAKEGTFQGNRLNGNIEETHISWVILTDEYAFKLKKPVKLSFLDYSTLQLRLAYCEKELRINSRYTDIYLAVLPVRKYHDQWIIGGEKGELVDYAVQMKKMDAKKQMDKLLENDQVSPEDIQMLAKKIASFHENAPKIEEAFDIEKTRNLFNDLAEKADYLEKELGEDKKKIIEEAKTWSDSFLEEHSDRFQERIEAGFKRDVHGDLHSGNIFILDKPVLFDGIEFTEEYRQIDILYEIAFLCMDLEAFGKKDLAKQFLHEYDSYLKVLWTDEDQNIFHYYKCLRTNIRAKIYAIGAQQAKDSQTQSKLLKESEKYLLLLREYINP